MIAAVDASGGIGRAGGLPWQLPADLKHFKEITSAAGDPHKRNAVIMGRKTWDSLPARVRPLPQRINGVLTGRADAVFPAGVLHAPTMDGMFASLESCQGLGAVFVIGGAQIFAALIDHPACAGIYLTRLKQDFNCDVFFPAIPPRFKTVSAGPWLTDAGLAYQFLEYRI